MVKVSFPSTNYKVRALTWGANTILSGNGPFGGTVFQWNDTAGGTMVTAASTSMNQGYIENITFQEGTNQPAHYLDMTAVEIDLYTNMNRVGFGKCTSDAVLLGTFFYLKWANIRWDGLNGGYAIRVTNSATQDAELVIDGFYYDDTSGTTKPEGFIVFDAGGVSNLRRCTLRNGHILTNGWSGAANAIFTDLQSGTGQNGQPLFLDNVTFQDTSASSVIVNRTKGTLGAAGGPAKLTVASSHFVGLTATLSGALNGEQPIPPVPAVGWQYAALSNDQALYIEETEGSSTPSGLVQIPRSGAYSTFDNGICPGAESMLRTNALTEQTLPSGQLNLAYFTAKRTETVTNVYAHTGSAAAAATPTLCRMGLYSVSPTGDLTLVASAANDTTKFAATYSLVTMALSASYNLVAGQRYAIGALIVSTAATPTLLGAFFDLSAGLCNLSPRISGAIAGESDLPSTILSAAVNGGAPNWFAVTP